MSLIKTDLDLLKKPFDEKTICVKVQSRSKDKTKAGLVLYLQHTDVYDRIEAVDPAWSCEITGEQHFPAADASDDWFVIRAKVTIKGVARENAGEGRDKKSATSDAIKRAAMLFGVGRYLYDTETVWVPYDEKHDYYKTYTISEYLAALRPGQVRPPISGSAPTPPPAAGAPQTGSAPAPGPRPNGAAKIPTLDGKARAQLGVKILEAGKAAGLSGPEVGEYVQQTMNKSTGQLTIEEMNTVLAKLQFELGRNGA